jgi:hypothetical protein
VNAVIVHLPHDAVMWQALVNAAIDLRVQWRGIMSWSTERLSACEGRLCSVRLVSSLSCICATYVFKHTQWNKRNVKDCCLLGCSTPWWWRQQGPLKRW